MTGRKTEASRAADRTKGKSVRARLADDLEANYDQLMGVIGEALKAERTVKITEPCHKCGCSHFRYVKVQDTGMAIKAAEFLANQGLGRPGEDQTRVEASFVVNRHVVEPEEGG